MAEAAARPVRPRAPVEQFVQDDAPEHERRLRCAPRLLWTCFLHSVLCQHHDRDSRSRFLVASSRRTVFGEQLARCRSRATLTSPLRISTVSADSCPGPRASLSCACSTAAHTARNSVNRSETFNQCSSHPARRSGRPSTYRPSPRSRPSPLQYLQPSIITQSPDRPATRVGHAPDRSAGGRSTFAQSYAHDLDHHVLVEHVVGSRRQVHRSMPPWPISA